MTKKNKQYYTVLAVLVLVILVIWLFKSKPMGTETANPATTGQTGQNQTSTSTNQTGTWTGTLRKSDAPAKGNLMLVTADRNIYFTTVRDYSSLMNTKVSLSYTGSLKGFTVLGVTAAK